MTMEKPIKDILNKETLEAIKQGNLDIESGKIKPEKIEDAVNSIQTIIAGLSRII